MSVSSMPRLPNYIVQIERIESVTKTNEFLSKLYKEQILEVRPMENNTYLVVYTKEIEND